MDQRDLAHWLDVMLRQGRAGTAYNVGSDEAMTIAELAHQVRDVLSPQKTVHIAAAQATPGSFRNRYVPCIDKARSELGLQLRHGLQQSIRDAAI